jgi:hypothetical protein
VFLLKFFENDPEPKEQKVSRYYLFRGPISSRKFLFFGYFGNDFLTGARGSGALLRFYPSRAKDGFDNRLAQ